MVEGPGSLLRHRLHQQHASYNPTSRRSLLFQPCSPRCVSSPPYLGHQLHYASCSRSTTLLHRAPSNYPPFPRPRILHPRARSSPSLPHILPSPPRDHHQYRNPHSTHPNLRRRYLEEYRGSSDLRNYLSVRYFRGKTVRFRCEAGGDLGGVEGEGCEGDCVRHTLSRTWGIEE